MAPAIKSVIRLSGTIPVIIACLRGRVAVLHKRGGPTERIYAITLPANR